MIFSQPTYFLLLFLSTTGFFLVPKRWRREVLIISGLIFYGYFGGAYVFLILGEGLLLYWLLKKRGIYSFLLALSLTLGILIYFKYWLFLGRILADLSTFIRVGLALPVGALAVPLAISFFTFEFIHLVIERYRGKIPPLSPAKLGAFIFFFPSLVAGPIKRFNDFDGQIDRARLTTQNVAIGIFRILVGLVKKLVLADSLAAVIGTSLTTHAGVEAATIQGLWLALFGFAWRIYFDFSGYSDIAIGSGRVFGIIIPENFSQPYWQTNIAAFWRSWHRTLTSWIIDYIYIPLGGSRGNLLSACANTLIAMAISGLWHGAGVNFILWGVYHGILLISYRLYRTLGSPLALPRIASIFFTFSFVAFGWLLFVAPLDVAQAAFTKLIGKSP